MAEDETLLEIGSKLEVSDDDIKRIRRKKKLYYIMIGAIYVFLSYLSGLSIGQINPYGRVGYPFGLTGLSSTAIFSKKVKITQISIVIILSIIAFYAGFVLGFNWEMIERDIFGIVQFYGVYGKKDNEVIIWMKKRSYKKSERN